MAENQNTTRPMPNNIFGVINQNVVDLSQDIVKLYGMVAEIHAALYPVQETSEPDADGAETINE